jgi:hypothetical protein
MKPLLRTFFPVFALLFVLSSCDKKTDDPVPTINMNVAGIPWVASEFAAHRYADRIEITAFGEDSADLLIILPADTSATYHLTNKNVVLAFRPLGGTWHTSQWLDNATDSIEVVVGATTITGKFKGSVKDATSATTTVAINTGILESVPMTDMASSTGANYIEHDMDGTKVSYSGVTTDAAGADIAINGSNAGGTFSFLLPANAKGLIGISDGDCFFLDNAGGSFGTSDGAAVVLRNTGSHMTILYYMYLDNLLSSGGKQLSKGYLDVTY